MKDTVLSIYSIKEISANIKKNSLHKKEYRHNRTTSRLVKIFMIATRNEQSRVSIYRKRKKVEKEVMDTSIEAVVRKMGCNLVEW